MFNIKIRSHPHIEYGSMVIIVLDSCYSELDLLILDSICSILFNRLNISSSACFRMHFFISCLRSFSIVFWFLFFKATGLGTSYSTLVSQFLSSIPRKRHLWNSSCISCSFCSFNLVFTPISASFYIFLGTFTSSSSLSNNISL